jgi:signal transduction histidine kinase
MMGDTVGQAAWHHALRCARLVSDAIPEVRTLSLRGAELMSWQMRSVRARVLLLVLVPMLSLFGLYLFITGITGKDALNLARARALKTATSESVSNFLGQRVRVADLRLLLFGGLGLLAVVASIVVALLVGRGLVRELSDLRRSAEDAADRRLPRMMDQLAAGEDPAAAEEPPDIEVKTTEIAQIRDAFAKVQHTAVDAAVDQARLREGIGEVFRSLARRSQSLLHRQLALLDRMERRTEDPQELADLFRIHHLTTRMRRHAESLVVLSGQSPARGWRNPVPFVDVIRAAVAEVEEYTRVSVISAGDTSLAGPAVGDAIHMIAELVENATIYSPPNTPVVIQGGIVGQGFVVEIEDRGFGMSDDRLAQANANLADPLPFSPTGNDQFGLLVAGHLAKRHDIQITLRRNPYGGTTAIVLLPHGIVVAGGFGELEPAEGLGEPEPAKALEGTPPMLGRYPVNEHSSAGGGADTEPDLPDGGRSGEAAAADAAPLAYQAAPPAAAPVPAAPPSAAARPSAAPSAVAPPAVAPPCAAAGPPPSAEAGAPGQAGAESRAWTGMESPAWSGPPQPSVNFPAWNGTNPPMLPRRLRQASPAPELADGPPAYSSLPGRFPGPPEEANATVSPIRRGVEQGRSIPGRADGLAPEPGVAEADGADSGGAAGAGGARGA